MQRRKSKGEENLLKLHRNPKIQSFKHGRFSPEKPSEFHMDKYCPHSLFVWIFMVI